MKKKKRVNQKRRKKQISIISVLVILTVVLCGFFVEVFCAPKAIELNTTAYSLYPAESVNVEVADYKNSDLTWSSNDSTIAVVKNGTITAVSPGTTQITVGNGNSEETIDVTVVDLPTPENPKAKKTGATSIKISWTKVKEAQFYNIYRSTASQGEFELISSSDQNSYVDKAAATAQTYFYKVTACTETNDIIAESGQSDFSDGVVMVLSTPNITANAASTTSITVSWDAVDNATEYVVYGAKSKNGTYKKLAETKKTSYKNKDLTCGKTYYYKVKAVSTNSTYNSDKSTAVSCKATLATPDKLTAKKTGTQEITISWEKVKGAKSYSIYRSTSKNGEYQKIVSTKNTSYVDTYISTGKTYYYKVRAIYKSAKGNSRPAQSKAVVVKLPKVSGLSVQCNAVSKAKITWDGVKNAKIYKIYRSTSKDGTYKRIKTTDKTTYQDKNLKVGKTYYYKIIAQKSQDSTKYNSSYSAAAKVKIIVPATTLDYSIGSSKIALSWSKSSGADKYIIYRKTKGGKYKKLATTTKLTYKDSDIKKGKIYYYKVRACVKQSGKTYYSKYSNSIKAAFFAIDPDAPMIALTFDDGPSSYTDKILDCLEKYNAHATFFVVGNRVSTYSDEVKRAYSLNCQIASHSYDHAQLTTLSKSTLTKNLSKTDSAIKDIIGTTPAMVRPPYGSYNSTVGSVAKRPLILWSIDTLDWKTRNSNSTYNTVMNEVKDGNIILMHDIYSQSADAAVKLIPALIEKGYQLVTVEELAYYKGVTLENGKAYSSIR